MSRLPTATRLLLGAIAAFAVAAGGLAVAVVAGMRVFERAEQEAQELRGGWFA